MKSERLKDGTPVYSYIYKGDPLKRMDDRPDGQDVKKRRPDAVVTLDDEDGTMAGELFSRHGKSRLMSMAI